jgi:hypothetical protein
MDDWIEFEGRVVPMIWGKATYTVLPLPSHVTDQFLALKAKRVEGEINDHPVNCGFREVPDSNYGKSRTRISVSPGQGFR